MTYEFDSTRFFETGDHVLVADASDLGFRPDATMPRTIVLVNHAPVRTKTAYTIFSADREDGEIAGWTYRSAGRPRLVVFND